MALDLNTATGVADGFTKYGPYIWGLSVALVVLAVVSVALIRSKDAQIKASADREKDLREELKKAHVDEVAALRSVIPVVEKLLLAISAVEMKRQRKTGEFPAAGAK